MYTARVIESVEQFNSLESSWNALLARSNNPTVFNTFGWASCWLQVYWLQDYALRIILLETTDGPIALLPLYIKKQERSCWFIGTGEPEAEEVASEYMDFVVHADHASSAELTSAINAQLEALKCRLVLVNCCANSFAATLLQDNKRALCVVTGAVYKLAIQKTFADTARPFSKNQQKKARQCLNRFNAASELEYVPFNSDSFDEDWQTLQTLHQKDWTSRGKYGAFHSEKFSHFHALMRVQQPQLTQAFVALLQNGDTLAIHHFYVFNGHYCFYLAGTEKSREGRLSPGLMLHVLAMQELGGNEVTYDFLKGSISNSYKAKFCSMGEVFYTITVFEKTLRGSLQHLLARMKQRVKSWRKPVGNDKPGSAE